MHPDAGGSCASSTSSASSADDSDSDPAPPTQIRTVIRLHPCRPKRIASDSNWSRRLMRVVINRRRPQRRAIPILLQIQEIRRPTLRTESMYRQVRCLDHGSTLGSAWRAPRLGRVGLDPARRTRWPGAGTPRGEYFGIARSALFTQKFWYVGGRMCQNRPGASRRLRCNMCFKH